MYVCNRHLVSSKPAFNLMLHHFKNPPHRLKASLFTIHLQCVVMKISYSNPHPTKFNKSDIFFRFVKSPAGTGLLNRLST